MRDPHSHCFKARWYSKDVSQQYNETWGKTSSNAFFLPGISSGLTHFSRAIGLFLNNINSCWSFPLEVVEVVPAPSSVLPPHSRTLMTNSAKYAHYAPGGQLLRAQLLSFGIWTQQSVLLVLMPTVNMTCEKHVYILLCFSYTTYRTRIKGLNGLEGSRWSAGQIPKKQQRESWYHLVLYLLYFWLPHLWFVTVSTCLPCFFTDSSKRFKEISKSGWWGGSRHEDDALVPFPCERPGESSSALWFFGQLHRSCLQQAGAKDSPSLARCIDMAFGDVQICSKLKHATKI